jgi:hypothetical protein
MNKIRKQIYLTHWQDQRLAELAKKTSTSEAEIIRHALDAYLLALNELPPNHPLTFLAGMGSSSSPDSGASDHDRVIYRP